MIETVEQALARVNDHRHARLLVVSDSHGRTDGIERIMAQFDRIDLILHLGDHQSRLAEIELEFDCPVLGVAGNCDHDYSTGQLPTERLTTIAGHRVFMTHGHHYHVKQGYDQLLNTAAAPPYLADLICFGHTHHQLYLEKYHAGRRIRLINPGSCYPDRHGPHGLAIIIEHEKILIEPLLDLPAP